MKKYYLTDGEKTQGPFSVEELKEKGITRDSYVWYEELGDWQTAGSLEELKDIFEGVPVSPPSIQPPPVVGQPPTVYPMAGYAAPPVARPSRALPMVLIGIGVAAVAFVVLLLVGVIKIPGVLDGGKEKAPTAQNEQEANGLAEKTPDTRQDDLGGVARGRAERGQGIGGTSSNPYVGDPYTDAMTFIRAQEEFARIANEAAEDGILDSREKRQLENAYRDVLLFLVKYEGDKAGQEELEGLLDGALSDRSSSASIDFSFSILELVECEGFEEFGQKMQEMADQLDVDWD